MMMESYVDRGGARSKEDKTSQEGGKGEDDLGPLEVMCRAKYRIPTIIDSSIANLQLRDNDSN